MTPELKRWYKKKCKLNQVLAWIMVIIFTICFSFPFIFTKYITEPTAYFFFSTTIISVIIGIILNGIASSHRRELINYKYSIREYRIRRNYVKAMQYLTNNDLVSAVNMYNIIPSNHKCKDYLYISLFHEFKHSDIDTIKDKGIQNFNEFIESFKSEI